MVICGSYMHEFSVSKYMKEINNDKRSKEVATGKVAAHLCLTLNLIELKVSVKQDRVVTTLKFNQILNIIFSVVVHVNYIQYLDRATLVGFLGAFWCQEEVVLRMLCHMIHHTPR